MYTEIRAFCIAHRRHLRNGVILLLLALLYYLLCRLGIGFPCPLRKWTGLACPGCGISHFFMDLLRFDFISAVQQNWAVALLVPLWLITGIVFLLFRPKSLQKNGRAFQMLIWGSLVFLLLFGLLRNLPAFDFLLPLYLR